MEKIQTPKLKLLPRAASVCPWQEESENERGSPGDDGAFRQWIWPAQQTAHPQSSAPTLVKRVVELILSATHKAWLLMSLFPVFLYPHSVISASPCQDITLFSPSVTNLPASPQGWPTGALRWMHRVCGQQVQEITLQPPPWAVQICTSLFYSAAGFLTKHTYLRFLSPECW